MSSDTTQTSMLIANISSVQKFSDLVLPLFERRLCTLLAHQLGVAGRSFTDSLLKQQVWWVDAALLSKLGLNDSDGGGSGSGAQKDETQSGLKNIWRISTTFSSSCHFVDFFLFDFLRILDYRFD